MKPPFLTIVLILSFLHFPSSTSAKIKCNPHDKKALLEIKQAFKNPRILLSWDPEVAADCCTSWYGVECDPRTNRVVTLVVMYGEISGEIPAAVGDLTYLENLYLRKLRLLTGPIPPAIAKLSHLQRLDLSWNNLTGPIPLFLTQLKKLTSLDLSFNNLTGSIPPSLFHLPNLEGLRLDRNRLTGRIPDYLGKITYVYFNHNQLSGTVPRNLGNFKFNIIDFSRNRLEGDVSFLFGKNQSVQAMDLSRNMFEFDLSKVEFPVRLSALDLNHNRITGTLPVGLTALEYLMSFNVSYNRLCGKIPQGGRLPTEITAYFHNRCLCGAPLLACK